MKITLVAGARPNFIKVAPLIRAIEKVQQTGVALDYRLVHTGQHYDDKLSRVFFEHLNIPDPHVNLGAGSGSQAEQTARIMVGFEKDLLQNPTDLVIVVGDVNSTMACTIVAKKLLIPVAHVEGGIRSFDMTMPEEINRMVTDSIADYFFTTSRVAGDNLRQTGVKDGKIFFVGNTMIDTLLASLPRSIEPAIWKKYSIKEQEYLVLTLHRPSNVDDAAQFGKIMEMIDQHAEMDVIFPIHPRTQKNFDAVAEKMKRVRPCEPLSYFEFIHLLKHAKGVITDSGGVQEEATMLGVPCATMRASTERPETVTWGTNEVIGDQLDALGQTMNSMQRGVWKKGTIPELWDGKSADRIIHEIVNLLR